MKKYVDGQYTEMTPEEASALASDAQLPPTAEQRLTALEAAMLEMIVGGDENA